MNCLEFRRLLLAEPASKDTVLREHYAGCAACAKFSDELGQFEASLKHVTHTEVPEGLTSRILLRQRLAEQQKRRRTNMFAIAASIVLSVTVALGFAFLATEADLQQVVLKHVNDELHHLDDRKDVSISSLNGVLRAYGTEVQSDLGRPVHYAGACQIRKQKGVHVVVDSKSGPLTVLFMPGEHVKARVQIKDARFKGVILPTSNGSMAIVGEDSDEIDQLEQQLKQNLKFIS